MWSENERWSLENERLGGYKDLVTGETVVLYCRNVPFSARHGPVSGLETNTPFQSMIGVWI